MTKRKRLKDRQYNDQGKKTKGQTNDPQHTLHRKLLTLPEHSSSPPLFSGVRVAQ